MPNNNQEKDKNATDPAVDKNPADNQDPNKGNDEPSDPEKKPDAPLQNDGNGEDPNKDNKPEPKKLSRKERLEYAKGKIEKELAELMDDSDDDERPATMGDLKRMKQQETKQTAITLAEAIENEDERNAVIEALEDTIMPSDDPQKDLQKARDLVNATKNRQILEEQARNKNPNSHGNHPAQPGDTPETFTPTAEEVEFMKPPYNLTKDQILDVRKKAAANAQ